MSEERIQKILARAGVASRRKAEELIEQGLVTVNGRVAGLGDKADPERDAIKVDGKRVQPASQEHRYLLLNKPKEVMSTVSDPEGRKTVMDFVPPGMRKALVPVGRLDYNTEGLLLLTDDGEFAQRIAHPRYGSTKTYEVKVKGTPSESQLDRLRNGVLIEGRRTAPAKITARNPFKPTAARRRGEPESENSWWIVEITEGRTRQIREMFFQTGHPVQKLRRVAIGPLRDPELPLGALRELTDQEVRKLLKSARAPEEKAPAPRKPAPARKSAPPKRAAAKKVTPVRKAARKPKGSR
jgi:23S rRNA pseudouridine2605 synthase